jgi:hypothetical protein
MGDVWETGGMSSPTSYQLFQIMRSYVLGITVVRFLSVLIHCDFDKSRKVCLFSHLYCEEGCHYPRSASRDDRPRTMFALTGMVV